MSLVFKDMTSSWHLNFLLHNIGVILCCWICLQIFNTINVALAWTQLFHGPWLLKLPLSRVSQVLVFSNRHD